MGWRLGCIVRICRRGVNPPLPSILLANVQSLENQLDDLHSRLSYQRDIKNCNIIYFTESWLNDESDNIQLAGFSVHRQDRTAQSGKTRGGGVCLFINNS
jgi:ribosome assembly protein 1